MVHSTEWSTGSRLSRLLTQFPHFSQGASGPLGGVDHWLTTFQAFDLVSALFPGAFDLVSVLFLAFALISAFFLAARPSP